jgi:uncharacterized protein YodC (DUF2158 family)
MERNPMAEVKRGDVVQLKSGGPRMTVADVGDYSPLRPKNGAKCIWFEGNKKNEDVFDVEVLTQSSRTSVDLI